MSRRAGVEQWRRRCLRPAESGWSSTGEWRCPSQADSAAAKSPCQNVDKGIKESDSVYRVNLSWNATETSMLYATWSEGYRPGGVQRNPAPAITCRTS